ncbi:MAG: hypothetical protein WDW36_002639 [Sanguina aurantia]
MLFDLDDCLYRNEAIPNKVRLRIMEFMVTRLGIEEAGVEALCTRLYISHGTTMAGLIDQGYKIDFDEWHEFIHYGTIDYEATLHADPGLVTMLNSIALPKFVLTNADKRHAELAMARLGITDCFQGIFHFENIQELGKKHGVINEGRPGPLCKPNKITYQLVLNELGYTAQQAIFLDDSIRNLAGAHELGILTVLVGRDTVLPCADLAILSCHSLPLVLAEVFETLIQEGAKEDLEQIEAVVAITVTA